MMKKILCFGDSNTYGHNPLDCSQLKRRWCVFVQEMLNQCEIIQDGRCGRNTKFDAPNEPDLNGLVTFREKYIENKDQNEFDLIIIMLGTNDLLNDFKCKAEETAESVSEYIKDYRAKFGEKTEFLVVSPILVRECVMDNAIFKEKYSLFAVEESKRFCDCFESMARRENVHFLDAAKYSSASPLDGIHMEEDEHRKLAQAIAKKIKAILYLE